MAQRLSQAALVLLLATATWCTLSGDLHAQSYGQPGWVSPEPNYYAMPTGPDGLTAALYPSPRPTPPLIGQTYITYEPLSPAEFLERHVEFHKTNNGHRPLTRTTIMYGHHPTLWPFHPSLTNAAPGLHTPASICPH